MLIPDWKRVLRKAWSMRLMGIAAVLSFVEVIMPFLSEKMPRGVFAVLSGLTVAGAFIARLVAQKEFSGDDAQ